MHGYDDPYLIEQGGLPWSLTMTVDSNCNNDWMHVDSGDNRVLLPAGLHRCLPVDGENEYGLK
jgi:hypothetical protein